MLRKRGVLLLLLLLSACAGSVTEEALRIPWEEGVYAPTKGVEGAAALAKFQLHLEKMGMEIRYVKQPENLAGLADLQRKVILIDGSLNPNGKLETLAHEAAHVIGPPNLPKGEGEVFAELVSVEVCRRLGLDTKAQAAKYLAQYKYATTIASLYAIDIERAAGKLVPE